MIFRLKHIETPLIYVYLSLFISRIFNCHVWSPSRVPFYWQVLNFSGNFPSFTHSPSMAPSWVISSPSNIMHETSENWALGSGEMSFSKLSWCMKGAWKSWDIHGIFMGYWWDTDGILMGYSWDIHGLGFYPYFWIAADNSTSLEARPSKDRQSNFISGKDVDDLGVLKIEQCTPNLGQFLWGKSWKIIINIYQPSICGYYVLRQTHLVSSCFFSHSTTQ